MSERRHSPLPWVWWCESEYGYWELRCASGNVVLDDGSAGSEYRARICPTDGGVGQANAAFIVRACNSHYAMVRALREIVSGEYEDIVLSYLAGASKATLEAARQDFAAARAALATAKGETS